MNINKEYNFIDEKKLETFVDKTIKAWGTAKKADINNLVDFHGYYYEGGEDAEYTGVDHLWEIVSDRREILKDTITELQGLKDKLEYSLEIISK